MMLQGGIVPGDVIKLIELVGVAGVGYIGLRIQDAVGKIRLEQAEVKAELLKGQVQMREDFDAKHAENAQKIAVHDASDAQKFDAIKSTLERIDRKLDPAR